MVIRIVKLPEGNDLMMIRARHPTIALDLQVLGVGLHGLLAVCRRRAWLTFARRLERFEERYPLVI